MIEQQIDPPGDDLLLGWVYRKSFAHPYHIRSPTTLIGERQSNRYIRER
jgi:hypothetical protein